MMATASAARGDGTDGGDSGDAAVAPRPVSEPSRDGWSASGNERARTFDLAAAHRSSLLWYSIAVRRPHCRNEPAVSCDPYERQRVRVCSHSCVCRGQNARRANMRCQHMKSAASTHRASGNVTKATPQEKMPLEPSSPLPSSLLKHDQPCVRSGCSDHSASGRDT